MIKHLLSLFAALAVLGSPSLAAQKRPLVISPAGVAQQVQAGDTIIVNASTTAGASLNLPHGTAPTSPANGDLWTTTGGVYARVNGATVGALAGLNTAQTWTGAQTFSQITTVDMGTSSVPALWLKTSLGAAWPGLLIENTKSDAAGQVQLFWKRWDASGNPLVWQAALDVDNNGGFKGLFNIEAIDITGPGVISTPFSAARSGEVGIGTGVPVSGVQLTAGGEIRSRFNGATATGKLSFGSGTAWVYGDTGGNVIGTYIGSNPITNVTAAGLFPGVDGTLLLGASGSRWNTVYSVSGDFSGGVSAQSVKLSPRTVSALPTCNAGAEGTLFAVTDANSTTFNATVAGGGSNHVMAYCNGTNWTVH